MLAVCLHKLCAQDKLRYMVLKSSSGRPKLARSCLKLAANWPKLALLGAAGTASGLLGRSWPLWGRPSGSPGRLWGYSWWLFGLSWTDLGPL